MITRRARRWLRRGITITIIVAVLLLGAATWVFTRTIENELLTVAGTAEEADPASVGLEFEDVVLTGPLGAYPAWRTEGTDDTWVILVHGARGTRDQMLDALRVVADLGLPAIVPTYRNDARAPASGSGRHTMGGDEWEDLEAAAVHAFREGAVDLIMFGFDSGGSAALKFVRDSEWTDRVAGVILDSPLLDPSRNVDVEAEDSNFPTFMAGWAKALSTLRYGIDWADLDHVTQAEGVTVPVLLIHGDADEFNPIEVSDAFAEALPEQVRYRRLPGVGHLGGYRSDRARYVAAVTSFLEAFALGDSELAPVEPELLEPEE